jgi:3-deoxy-D-manno-octulosonate 8-phosphate phosphatase (KDO 8-P phosphatase)
MALCKKGKTAVIRLLVLDVDGTLTDGGIYIDGRGNEMKRFHVRDGMGLALLRKSGVRVAVISGRFSLATEARMKELDVSIVKNGVGEKLPVLKEIAEDLGLASEEIAYAGDDINDVGCVKWAGQGYAVLNACEKLKGCADFVTKLDGGHGAVREICERIISSNDTEKMETGEIL